MTTLKAMAADLDQDPRAQRRRELPDRDPMARRLRMQDSRGRLSDTVADIESDVVAALGLGQFSLLYQPRMALDSGDVVAVEALLRWQDSARGLLGPKAFLPLVAQTSAMVALGQWVLYEASREAARWELERPAGVRPVMVSVNVAALEVLEPAFFDSVQLILEEHALPTTQLQLEIDASDPLRGETVVTTRLGLLRDEGVRVAIDGACPQLGSGSLHLDADSVHLHRRWTRSIANDAALAEAVAGLVERTHRSGGTVCAMGVETQAQADVLSVVGCDLGQGYFYCDPVPSDLIGWLDS